jgi:hydrogenase maturation protease
MTPLANSIEQNHSDRVCFVGLGNPEYGDDGFGVRLASELREAGMRDVAIAGTTPEQCLGQITAQGFDRLVFLDTADFGATPGSLVVMGAEQIQARYPQISTHKLSLAALAELAQANGRTKAWLLGVQPQSIKPGYGLTPTVQTTLEIIRELLLDTASCEAMLEPTVPCLDMDEHLC